MIVNIRGSKVKPEIEIEVLTKKGTDGALRNKYTNDVGKLAAWVSASHVEKAPKKKKHFP